ncbi:MAG: Na+/H+ antiporter subunit E [Blastochloris sp.]|nr:Na+/H+ antiporter subunit E [Blastochloris sp.]
MLPGFLLHLTLSLLWMFLSQGALPQLIVGLVGSFLLLACFRSVLPIHHYVRRTYGLVRFLYVFIRELALANLTIAHFVLFKKTSQMHPNFITYSTKGLASFEIYLLSQCITLTPGTTTVDVRLEEEELLLHAFEAADPAAVCSSIDLTLKQAILGFTR